MDPHRAAQRTLTPPRVPRFPCIRIDRLRRALACVCAYVCVLACVLAGSGATTSVLAQAPAAQSPVTSHPAASPAQSPGTPPDTAGSGVATILVSRQLAESEGLTVGNTVRLATDAGGTNVRAFRIAGIYEPTPDPQRLGSVPREVRLHLPELLDMTRPADVPAGTEHVSGINIGLADAGDARAFARDVGARMPGVVARPAEQGNAGPFLVLERFHLAIATVTIVAATVFLLALTIMLVDERRETVGVLRLIGLPVRRILVQILIEGLLVATSGAAFGLILAVLSQSLINGYFQWRYDTSLIFVQITRDVAATCVAIAVPLGAAATVTASWALLRRNGLRLARR